LQKIVDEQTGPWGVKVTIVEVKDVELPQSMQRAMAKQAEAEREKRAKIIHAAGEFEASKMLAEAADVIAREPVTLQLRYLQTLTEIAVEKNSTIVFPLPVDTLKVFMDGIQAMQNGHGAARVVPTAAPPAEPPAPGTPGGLPDDRTPVPEAPFAPTSAQGAANVVQTYYALLEAGKYGEAWKLWSDGGKASGMTREAFAASFAKYAEYHAQVGAPGRIEGAAGSSYVDVPVVVYGRLKSGGEVHMNGPVTLRRVNDVPGSSAEQRLWHISASGVRPRPR
jgi:hypothetical protein